MSYKIRYGYDKIRTGSPKQVLITQSLVSGSLLCLAGAARCFLEGADRWKTILCASPTTVAERAVAALSQALAGDQGWYHALAVWCRTIIDSGAV